MLTLKAISVCWTVVSAVNPSVNVVRKFVHLLDVGDNDYAEEFGNLHQFTVVSLFSDVMWHESLSSFLTDCLVNYSLHFYDRSAILARIIGKSKSRRWRSEHPVYDHLPVRSPILPSTQSDAVIGNESAPHYSPCSMDRNLTLVAAVLTR